MTQIEVKSLNLFRIFRYIHIDTYIDISMIMTMIAHIHWMLIMSQALS